jgi:AraC-like DNA-binding protein
VDSKVAGRADGQTDGQWYPAPLAEYSTYLTPSQRHRRLGLAALGAGWHSMEQDAVHGDARVLDCYGLHVVTRGTGWIETGRRPRPRLPIRAPAAFWLFPGLVHTYRPTGTGWSVTWVLFDGPAAPEYEALGLLDRAAPVVPLVEAEPVRTLFQELFTTVRAREPLFEVAAGTSVHRLIQAVDAAGRRVHVSRAVCELDEHALEPISLREHARRIGLSEHELREEVRGATGSTPKDYILRLRLNAAKDLLATTDRSVAQIAQAVGYDDPAYFTRLFTRRVGRSPTAFRRETTPRQAADGAR